MIAQRTIDEVLAAANVAEIVGDDHLLKRSGSGLTGLCPFHNEKTPSFHVSPAKGIYKCFGCGKAGNAITWLTDYKGLPFPDAVRHLAARYSISVMDDQKPEDPQVVSERELQRKAARMAADTYTGHLASLPNTHPAWQYLLHWRKIDKQEVAEWDLGYAPDEWRFLVPNIIKADLWTAAEAMGMVAHKNGKNYDVYRGRIIFPIQNLMGEVVGFGARVMDDSEPKYLNSNDCLLYSKEHTLYGLFQARGAIKERGHAWLVEGYTDVISMHRAGYLNTVASCGTSFTEGQAKVLARFTKRVIVYFDPDCYHKDGKDIRADKVWKVMRKLMAHGIHVQVCRMQQDPDEWVREGISTQPLAETTKEGEV